MEMQIKKSSGRDKVEENKKPKEISKKTEQEVMQRDCMFVGLWLNIS
jgi:hypothetical protein